MQRAWKIAFGGLILAGLVYLYYTEVKPVVIFGLRSDYAHAIPYQNIPAGLDSLKAESCGTCHREALTTYRDSLHGQVTALGFTPVAKCADCHQSHRVFRTSDARSSVSPANRLATCQTCHASANLSFISYQPHANRDDRGRLPALYYAGRFMDALLYGVFAFFGVHTLLWLVRERAGPSDDKGTPHG